MRTLFIDVQLDIRKVDDMQVNRAGVAGHDFSKVDDLLLCSLAGVGRRIEINRIYLDASLGNHVTGYRRVDTT